MFFYGLSQLLVLLAAFRFFSPFSVSELSRCFDFLSQHLIRLMNELLWRLMEYRFLFFLQKAILSHFGWCWLAESVEYASAKEGSILMNDVAVRFP